MSQFTCLGTKIDNLIDGNKRLSFFNYKFILNRICTRLGYKHLLKYFKPPKNSAIVRSQDDILHRITKKFV